MQDIRENSELDADSATIDDGKKSGEREIPAWWLIGMVFASVLLVLLDQVVKYQAVVNLKGQDAIVVIPGVLEFLYLENHGAAFSMLQDQQWFFYILTAVFLAAAVWFIRKIPKKQKFRPLIRAVFILCAGAVGNLIDRILYRYVVDFIYFSLIDFPVFNIADIYVTLSVIAIILLVLFHYKDEDFKEIFGK